MSQALSVGSRLKERYRIERELGRGGIGVVYLARDERLHGMPVVIKFLLDASGQNAWLWNIAETLPANFSAVSRFKKNLPPSVNFLPRLALT